MMLEKAMPGKTAKTQNQRYYGIGGITIKVESELPITDATFSRKLKPFEIDVPGEDVISIKHFFSMPGFKDLGEPLYWKNPWLIFKNSEAWTYVAFSGSRFGSISGVWKRIFSLSHGFLKRASRFAETSSDSVRRFPAQREIYQVGVFNEDYSRGTIHNKSKEFFSKGNLDSITLFPTDQVILSKVFAHRAGCLLHAAGVSLEGRGLLFVGSKDAGKSTMVTMLRHCARILCDDRIIVRKREEGFKVYGTWSPGDVADVSPDSVPLAGLIFLEKGHKNQLVPLRSKPEIIRRLLPCIIKPFVTAEWWEKTLLLVEKIVREVPCYTLCFDRSGAAVSLLKSI
ncbi:MAG: hypothetical protein JRI79_05640 [Deltaproteobacteria bacterium]|nr:hypothetical protein [Deltaproteobacteria bacterium]MBW2046080.1 hypothetical protein [Deltaproteobacteria bacterium]MBW2299649.1 hypothetical protein [Deltaproteobacteria bacterium]